MSAAHLILLDGLPPSSASEELIRYYELSYAVVHYVNFLEHKLTDNIVNELYEIFSKTLEAIPEKGTISIVATSFGSYMVLHSMCILTKYSYRIISIELYSPVARLKKVVKIQSLPSYLRNNYKNFYAQDKPFFQIDESFNEKQLLKDDVKRKVNIFYALKDRQVLAIDIENYYKDFILHPVNEGHVGLRQVLNRLTK